MTQAYLEYCAKMSLDSKAYLKLARACLAT